VARKETLDRSKSPSRAHHDAFRAPWLQRLVRLQAHRRATGRVAQTPGPNAKQSQTIVLLHELGSSAQACPEGHRDSQGHGMKSQATARMRPSGHAASIMKNRRKLRRIDRWCRPNALAQLQGRLIIWRRRRHSVMPLGSCPSLVDTHVITRRAVRRQEVRGRRCQSAGGGCCSSAGSG
jgi:hypothetical protein